MAAQNGDSVVRSVHMACVDDFERYAEKSLASSVLGYAQGGADDEVTLKENVASFKRCQIVPRVLRGVSLCKTDTTILGNHIAFPICIAPIGYVGLFHPDKEIAVARAASSLNTALALSTLSTSSLEDVSEACDDGTTRFFQLYVGRDHDASRRLVERAERAGYSAIFITVDVPVFGKRRAQFYNASDISHLQIPHLEQSTSEKTALGLANAFIDPCLTWDIITWLKSITTLPIVVKGILSVDDAVEAVRLGASGVVVSNHGGRQLDTVPAPLEVLSEVVQAVAGRCEVYLDGGVRTGTDAFKALALGAKAVFVGRPVIYGLAYNGEAGARQVLSILRDELTSTMMLAGCSSVDEINQSFIRYPTRPYN